MFRMGLVLGIAVGFVLGARAGRERYDQLVVLASKARVSPAIQGAAGFVAAKATSLLHGRKHEPRRPDVAYFADEEEPPRSTSPIF